MLRGYPPGTFPPAVIIEMSQLPRSEKDKLMQMLMPKPQPPNPAMMAAQKLQLEGPQDGRGRSAGAGRCRGEAGQGRRDGGARRASSA